MSIRNRTSLQTFRQQLEDEENAKRESEFAPVRQAEQQLTNSLLLARSMDREAVLSDRPDPAFVLPAQMAGKRMSLADAQHFNTDEARKFAANNPDFYPSQKNSKAILD